MSALARKERKPKRQIDEKMIDQIVEETKQQKNLKEQIYEKINIPIWLLDIVIALCVAGLAYILIFKRA